MNEELKSVGYAYPTSPNACQFGFSSAGCYTVEIRRGVSPSIAIAAYATKGEAMTHAQKMTEAWDKFNTL